MATKLEMFFNASCDACSMRLQTFIEFELIITELCLALYIISILTKLVTSQVVLNRQIIFNTFLRITSQLKEIVYYIKRPIGLF